MGMVLQAGLLWEDDISAKEALKIQNYNKKRRNEGKTKDFNKLIIVENPHIHIIQ